MNAHRPADHPPIQPPKVGVLLANLGTPDGYDYWPMRRYLSEFLSDKRVVDMPDWKWQPILQGIILSFRPQRSGANYKKIWNMAANESPLLTITRAQTAAIAAQMADRHGDRVVVDFCMRYGNPSTASKVKAMVAAGCTKVLFFPLYPQFAGATTATANDAFFAALKPIQRPPSVRTVPEYFDHPAYVAALAASVRRAWDALPVKPEKLVASYHGMPLRYLMQGDPYHCQCQKTSRLLCEALGWDRAAVDTTFQSIFGREEWLKPYTAPHVAELAKSGIKRIAVISPAFSADCIETLEEIDGEIREVFLHAGGEEFTYIPCLNDEAAHVHALCQVIEDNLAGWLPA
jgi:ferrochelatase